MALHRTFFPNPDHCPISPNFANPKGAGLAETPTINEVGPGVRSPGPFFLSLLLKASLLSLPPSPPPLRPLVGLEAHSKATPCPIQNEWPSGSQWHYAASWHTWPCTCPGDQRSRPPGGVSPCPSLLQYSLGWSGFCTLCSAGRAHSPLASQGLGPPLASPSSAPRVPGAACLQGPAPPCPRGRGHKGALVTTGLGLGLGSLMPGSY